MKKRLAVLLSALLLLMMVVPAAAETLPPAPDDPWGHFSVVGQRMPYDSVTKTTTFVYTVEKVFSGSEFKDLSHMVLAVCEPLLTTLTKTQVSGSSSFTTAETFLYDWGMDASLEGLVDIEGFKWDNPWEVEDGPGPFGPVTFTVTFPGNIPASNTVRVQIKAGRAVDSVNLWGYTVGPSCGDTPVAVDSLITVKKFYDADGNQERSDAEPYIAWQVRTVVVADGVEGEPGEWVNVAPIEGATLTLTPGQTYRIYERSATGWTQTYPDSYFEVAVPANGVLEVTEYEFGNRLDPVTSANGTIGFWSNKNGQVLIGGLMDELNEMPYLYNSGGVTFGLGTSKREGTLTLWLRGASASNMWYMLSAQYVAAWLNVNVEYGTPGNWLYVTPSSEGEMTTGGDLFSLLQEAETLMAQAAAHAADSSLTAPSRAEMERVMKLLDRFNNNLLDLHDPYEGPVFSAA